MKTTIKAAAICFDVEFSEEALRALIRAGRVHYSHECKVAAREPSSDLDLGGFLCIAADGLCRKEVPRFAWRELDVIAKICESASSFVGVSKELVEALTCTGDQVARIFAAARVCQIEWKKELELSTKESQK